MAWEQRGNRRYFYRKRRIPGGGGVASEYIGCDLHAEIAAARVDEARRRHAEEQAAAREMQRNERELDVHLDRAWAAIDELSGFCLAAAGFHTHRGEVRRRSNRGARQ